MSAGVSRTNKEGDQQGICTLKCQVAEKQLRGRKGKLLYASPDSPEVMVYPPCETGRNNQDISIEMSEPLISLRGPGGYDHGSGQPFVFSALNRITVPRAMMRAFSGTEEEKMIKVLMKQYRFVGLSWSKNEGVWTDKGLHNDGVTCQNGGERTTTNNSDQEIFHGDWVVVTFPSLKNTIYPFPNTPLDKRVPVLKPLRSIDFFPPKNEFVNHVKDKAVKPIDPCTDNMCDALAMFALTSAFWGCMFMNAHITVNSPAPHNVVDNIKAADGFRALMTQKITPALAKAFGRPDLQDLTFRQAIMVMAAGVENRNKIPAGDVEIEQAQLAGYGLVDRAARFRLTEITEWIAGRSTGHAGPGQRFNIIIGHMPYSQ